MILCHQVSNFPMIELLSSTGWGSLSVLFVAMLDSVKRQSIPPKHHKQLTQWHSIAFRKIGSFIHAAMLTSNLASHLAPISCYEYYVRINMIIQSISIWFCINTEPSLWIRWPGHFSKHFPLSDHIKNEWKDTLLLLYDVQWPNNSCLISAYYRLTSHMTKSYCNDPCFHNSAIIYHW